MAKKKQEKKQEAENSKRPIDFVRQAYRDKRERVEVPEWPGCPDLYFSPLTTEDQEIVERRMRDDDGRDPDKHTHEKRLRLLIQKAELEDGSPAFGAGDLHFLKTEAPYAVIQRLAATMYRVALQAESLEDAKKKSGKTETSSSD